MNERVERGQSTRDTMVAVATRLFGERGYDGASIEAVLRESGVSRGALYHHFADKTAVRGGPPVGGDPHRRAHRTPPSSAPPTRLRRSGRMPRVGSLAADPVRPDRPPRRPRRPRAGSVGARSRRACRSGCSRARCRPPPTKAGPPLDRSLVLCGHAPRVDGERARPAHRGGPTMSRLRNAPPRWRSTRCLDGSSALKALEGPSRGNRAAVEGRDAWFIEPPRTPRRSPMTPLRSCTGWAWSQVSRAASRRSWWRRCSWLRRAEIYLVDPVDPRARGTCRRSRSHRRATRSRTTPRSTAVRSPSSARPYATPMMQPRHHHRDLTSSPASCSGRRTVAVAYVGDEVLASPSCDGVDVPLQLTRVDSWSKQGLERHACVRHRVRAHRCVARLRSLRLPVRGHRRVARGRSPSPPTPAVTSRSRRAASTCSPSCQFVSLKAAFCSRLHSRLASLLQFGPSRSTSPKNCCGVEKVGYTCVCTAGAPSGTSVRPPSPYSTTRCFPASSGPHAERRDPTRVDREVAGRIRCVMPLVVAEKSSTAVLSDCQNPGSPDASTIVCVLPPSVGSSPVWMSRSTAAIPVEVDAELAELRAECVHETRIVDAVGDHRRRLGHLHRPVGLRYDGVGELAPHVVFEALAVPLEAGRCRQRYRPTDGSEATLRDALQGARTARSSCCCTMTAAGRSSPCPWCSGRDDVLGAVAAEREPTPARTSDCRDPGISHTAVTLPMSMMLPFTGTRASAQQLLSSVNVADRAFVFDRSEKSKSAPSIGSPSSETLPTAPCRAKPIHHLRCPQFVRLSGLKNGSITKALSVCDRRDVVVPGS